MPLKSVRPSIIRGWTTELRNWDADPSTLDALVMRLEQIAAGHGVSLDHFRQAEDPDANWTAPREPGQAPDTSSLREQLKTAGAEYARREGRLPSTPDPKDTTE